MNISPDNATANAGGFGPHTTADPWLSGYCDNCLAPLRSERGRFFRYVCCSCDRDGCDACMPEGGTVPCPECCAEAGLPSPASGAASSLGAVVTNAGGIRDSTTREENR